MSTRIDQLFTAIFVGIKCSSLMPSNVSDYLVNLRRRLYLTQEVVEKNKESSGGPWEFLGLLPLFDPPRHDSAETIRRALNLGVSVKMITGMT